MSDGAVAEAQASGSPAVDAVDWSTVRRVARAVAGGDPVAASYLGASLQRDFAEVTAEAEELVADFTGLRSPHPASARVLDRRGWVDANVASMQSMVAPFTRRVAPQLPGGPIGVVGRHVAGVEMGLLLGYLAQRVLGQYDLLVPEEFAAETNHTDAVYYVGPNVLALEKRFTFRPRDFRLWIAIHEVTHRAQFTGVPWLREHFVGLVQRMLSLVEPDARLVMRAATRFLEAVREGRNPLDDGGLVALFATDEQRALLDQSNALMSLLEGHGNYVMNVLGARHVAGQERMDKTLSARRHSRGITAQVHKLVGMDMKLRQYEVGERFVRGVEREAGLAAIDRAWSGPESLPTSKELLDPHAWLERVDGAPVARVPAAT